MGTMGEPRLTSTLCPPPGPTKQGLASTGEENCTNVPGTGTFFPCTCSLRIDPPEEPHRRCLPAPIAIIGRYPRPYKVQTASQKLVELRLAIRKSHVRCAVMFTGVFRYWLHRFAPGSASSGSPARTGPRALCVIDDRPCARYAALPVPASSNAPRSSRQDNFQAGGSGCYKADPVPIPIFKPVVPDTAKGIPTQTFAPCPVSPLSK
ncbi:hypothetical protein C4K38_2306 [Pseudomonas chlororaphis subsp. piscium]|nr:hypothetical protein C4K38_2306 [Pseudomonas chlororaphis subsp. piscium]SDT21660.1 hypothetical protein SAMN05216585_5069 [Pseudomonas chlororaphis]